MKRIEVGKMRVGDLKHNFGNPRKITKKKAEELERSLDMFGDFGIFLVDEHDNVIASDMTMDTALILLRALFMEYYNESGISYQIVRKSNITSEG